MESANVRKLFLPFFLSLDYFVSLFRLICFSLQCEILFLQMLLFKGNLHDACDHLYNKKLQAIKTVCM